MNSEAKSMSVRCPRCWSPVSVRPGELTVRCPTCGATVDVVAAENANRGHGAAAVSAAPTTATTLETVEAQLADVRAQMDALRVPPITREVRQQLRPLREQEQALMARRDALRAALDPQSAAAFAAPPRANPLEADAAVVASSPAARPVTDDGNWLRKQFGYAGRIGRLNYVVVILASNAIYLFASIMATANRSSRSLWLALAVLALVGVQLWIWSAATVKRYHDRDKSGWWTFIVLIPLIGQIWQFVELAFFPGTSGPNRYGYPD